MGFRELIRKVQHYSGFSDSESKDAIEMLVESLAVHLTENERRAFANRLPQPLNDMALSVLATNENSQQDILEQFMEIENIDEIRAKDQIQSAWRALKETIGEHQIKKIRKQLPAGSLAFFH